ncbi:MAG TPA: carboxypeptidase regulatory-like domain-containing protein [Polyangiaceae bacterium]|nr:carboxypeptidase regulatory-like domain-containing protein [Polyangiaceae bacterium]
MRRETSFSLVFLLAGLVFLCGVPASVALRGPAPIAVSVPEGVARRGALLVTVRTSEGTSISGATVRVFWADDRRYLPAGGATTGPDGVARLSGLPEGASWVVVDAPGRARRSTTLVVSQAERNVVVTLVPATPLAVHVEDELHAPIATATVLVSSSDALPFGALTDLRGDAHFSRLGPPAWSLRAFARGYEPARQDDAVGDTTLVLRRASALDVAVVDEQGRPAPGATVLVAGSALWPARSALADGTGHARLSGISAGTYDAQARDGDRVSKTEIGVKVERGETHALTLVLRPGRKIPVVVTDGEGDHPLVVADADVVLVEGGVSSFPLQGRTDRFGKVVLGPVPEGDFVVAARADGFVSRDAVVVPDVVKDDVRVPLLRGGTLRGEVVDADSRPVDGATVEVVGTDTFGMPIAATPLAAELQRSHFAWALEGPAPLAPGGELGVLLGPIPPIPAEGETKLPVIRSPWDASGASAEPWVTRFDGTFAASPIPPGRVRALVRHPAYVEAASELVTLGPGGEATVRVVLRPGGAVEGTVVDDSGVPVAGARLDVSAAKGTLSRAVTTADDGTFALASMPRDLLVTIARPDEPYRAVVRKELTVPEGGKLEVTLTLPAPREPVEVSVEDDSHRPVKMAQVTALSLDPERPLRFTDFTDEAGRAVVKDAAGLSLRIVVESPGFARYAAQTDSAPTSIAVELASGVLVAGHVTAVRGRRDVEGATVELTAEGHRRLAVTNPLGVFQFPDVSPGSIHLRITHPDYAVTELDLTVQSTGRADRSFDLPDVDLPEPGKIAGRVVDSDGNPVAGARVGVGVVGAYLPVGALASGTVITKSDGAFELEHVHPGKVEVQAVLAGKGRGHASAVVEEDRTTDDVSIRLIGRDEADSTASGGVAVTLAETRKPGEGPKIIVVDVAERSEAEHAGLVVGDVLVSVDRVTPDSLDDARGRLSGPDGSDVIVEVLRGTDRQTLRIRRERVHR